MNVIGRSKTEKVTLDEPITFSTKSGGKGRKKEFPAGTEMYFLGLNEAGDEAMFSKADKNYFAPVAEFTGILLSVE